MSPAVPPEVGFGSHVASDEEARSETLGELVSSSNPTRSRQDNDSDGTEIQLERFQGVQTPSRRT